MPPQSNESKSQYQNNEKVLCFHGEFLYEAKIQDLRRTDSKDPKSPFEYKIHYKGWKNTWDDWVSFDRLRKWTDENRELAAQLRREHTQAQKALPKTTSKSRRGQGSEIGSGRGSEERTSSVPAGGGRGSKRGRDNDIEKVSKLSPLAMSRLPRVQTPFGDLQLLDNARDPGSLPGWDFLENTPGHTGNPGYRKPVSTPTVSTITSVDLDTDKDEEEQSKAQKMALKKIGQNNTVGLYDFVYKPRRAAVAAAKAINRSTHSPSLIDSKPAATKTRKRKGSEDIGAKGLAKRSTSASHARKVSGRLSERSISPRLARKAKKPRLVSSKGVAVRVNKPRRPAIRNPSRPSVGRRRSISYSTSSQSEILTSDVSSSDQETEDQEESDADLAESEYEDSDEDVLVSVESKIRKSSASTARGKLKSKPKILGEIFDSEDESSEVDSPPKKRVTRISARRSNAQPATIAKRSSSGSRVTTSAARSSKGARDRAKLHTPIKAAARKLGSAAQTDSRWINQTAEDFTSSSVNRLLRQPPPQNGPKSGPYSKAFRHSLLVEQDEVQDPDETEDEVQDSDETEDEELDILDTTLIGGIILKKKDLASQQRSKAVMSPILGYKDIRLQEIDGIWTAKKGASTNDLEVDPPGSGTPSDALRWPGRLIEKANRSGRAWPKHWDEDAIRSIPDRIFQYIRVDLLSKLRYDLLAYRPWILLKELPSSSPFWSSWNRYEGAPIIQGFLAKVHNDRARTEAAEALLLLAGVVPSAPNPDSDHLALTGKVAGFPTPLDVQDNLVRVYALPPSGPLALFIQVPMPVRPSLNSPGQIPRTTGRETHFPGLIADAQELMPYELILHRVRDRTYMELLYIQEDAYYSRPSIRINVPDHLKNLLVDDWEHVTKSQLLVPLPSQAPANYIIDEYFNEEKKNRSLESADADVLEEFCAGLKMYFEKAVGKILLYRFERSQLAEVRKLWESGKNKDWDGKGPGDCYGAEHLTRMIVNLPEMIAQTNMDVEAVARLKTELSKFSTWLSRNSTKFFCAKYEKPSAEYHEHAR